MQIGQVAYAHYITIMYKPRKAAAIFKALITLLPFPALQTGARHTLAVKCQTQACYLINKYIS